MSGWNVITLSADRQRPVTVAWPPDTTAKAHVSLVHVGVGFTLMDDPAPGAPPPEGWERADIDDDGGVRPSASGAFIMRRDPILTAEDRA